MLHKEKLHFGDSGKNNDADLLIDFLLLSENIAVTPIFNEDEQ